MIFRITEWNDFIRDNNEQLKYRLEITFSLSINFDF